MELQNLFAFCATCLALSYLHICMNVLQSYFLHMSVLKNEVDKLYLGIINDMYLYSWNFDMNNAKDYFTTLCYKCVFLMCKWSSRLLTFTEFSWILLWKNVPRLLQIFLFFFFFFIFSKKKSFFACYTIICDSIFTEVLAGTIALFSYPHKKCLLYL